MSTNKIWHTYLVRVREVKEGTGRTACAASARPIYLSSGHLKTQHRS